MIPLYKMSTICKSIKTESGLWLPGAEGDQKKWGMTANGNQISPWHDENVPKLIVMNILTTFDG